MSQELIEYLKKFVNYQSVSSDPAKRADSDATANFLKATLEDLGAQVRLKRGEEEKNQVVFGRLGEDPNKPTLALYGHYDVQPAAFDDGWDTEPFELIEKDGYLFGRGASDDKGPIAATLHAIKELQKDGELPINFRFLYEGEEESSSGGFETAVLAERDFIGECSGLLVMDTSWFTDTQPALTYGLRGMAYMGIQVTGLKKDLHSGAGGTIREPMQDLVELMSRLIDDSGKAQIDGFHDKVRPLTSEEEKLYQNLEFDINWYRTAIGVETTRSDDKVETLMSTWRYPSISLHGIEGAFSGPGGKTVIPAKVIGKVSMRLVPDQDPEEIAKLFRKQVEKWFAELHSPNKLEVITIGTGEWWYGDYNNPLYKSAHKALKDHWGLDPAYDRVGGSIPIVPFMERTLGAPAMLLGIGQPSDGAHSQNERIRIKNLVGGKEVLKLLFQNLGNEQE